jgi:hypothetical protein
MAPDNASLVSLLPNEYYLLMAQSSPGQTPEPLGNVAAGEGHVAGQGSSKETWITSPLAKGIGALLLAVVPAILVYISPWFQEHWDPPTKSVTVGAICLQSGITYGAYESAYKEKVTNPDILGLWVSIALTANGFDGDTIYLLSYVLNNVTGADALGSLQQLSEHRAVPVNASTVMRDPQVWVPQPTTAGQYVVLVRIMDGDLPSGNQGLAAAYSRPFTVDSDGRIVLSGLCAS